MDCIILKKEDMAFYFNQAELNLKGLENGILDNQRRTLLDKPEVLNKVENYIFKFKDVTKDAKMEIDCLISKLIELRNFYSHYVHTDTVKGLREGERSVLERYYQIAIEATGSETVKFAITHNNKLTEAGVLFLLCMFLKKSQANKLISSISGFKRNDDEGQPRRNLFTYYSVRDGYKVVPEMQKHFLLFQLVNHLVKQDENIKKLQQSNDIGKGSFFHRMASTFLNISGIMTDMKFYSYESKRLKEQRGDFKPEGGCFTWIEPFQGNSYFSIKEHKGVIGEEQLKELCYAMLICNKNKYAVEQIEEFAKAFSKAGSESAINESEILDKSYFPANYFAKSESGSPKKRILGRLKKVIESYKNNGAKAKAYEKMKEVLEFINNSLPAAEKLKRKDYRRYLKTVRFWGKERDNIKREFESKELAKRFSTTFWQTRSLEDVYKLARKENAKLFEDMKSIIEKMGEREFEKYQQVNDATEMESLKKLSREFNVRWQEKDWFEYSRQIKKRITGRQKLTIMKQRVTAGLKKKHGIENVNLRITTDSNKSRQAVSNRIAIPKGFVKRHILKSNEKRTKPLY